ncbi:MAG TPA: GtrA family protein [Caulobacteraceae bacterium]|jgi:putative flippase GtrA|nr:GtrA family protein [Caulobacteraceae bacterium]
MRRLLQALPTLAGTAMILLAVLAVGRPTVFPDTDDYFEHGKNFAFTTAYAFKLKAVPPAPTDPDEIEDAQQAAEDAHMSHPELAARSPYYGLLLYSSQRVGTLWLLTAIQAAIGAWLVWLLWRSVVPRAPLWTAYATEAACAFLSTLPFFAGFAMPDVFGGYVALSSALLVGFWERVSRNERAVLMALIVAGSTFHGSNPLLALAVGMVGGVFAWILHAPRRQIVCGVAGVTGAVIAALIANAVYMQAVKIKTGDLPGRPPFLAVRLLADGPGRGYLRYACAHGADYALCRYRDLPLDDTDEMLWSDQKTLGVFNMSDYPTRVRMEREEFRFALGTIAYDPFGVAGAALRNWGQELAGVYVDDPLRDPNYYLTNDYWNTTNLPWLIEHVGHCGHDKRGCKPRIDVGQSIWLHASLFVLALFLTLWRLGRGDVREAVRARDWNAPAARLAFALGLLVAALVMNAAICGILSGPFPRYQARLVWLLTAAAACGLASLAPARKDAWKPMTPMDWIRALPERHPWLKPVLAQRQIAWALSKVDPAFIAFGFVGVTGFLTDRLVLAADMTLGMNYFSGRFVSYPIAIAVTWFLNRTFTFRHAAAHHPPLKQAAIYVAVQVVGAVVNIAAYTLAIRLMPSLKAHLLIPLAIGSAVGLCVTFVGSRKLAFPVPPSAV